MFSPDLGVAAAMAQVAQTLGSSHRLEETLSRITASARDTIPGVDCASITVRYRDGRLETLAPTDDMPARADTLQYDYREGPCYHAVTAEGPVSSEEVGSDPRWPRYGPAAEALGLKSQLALPIYTSPQSRGALNLYSRVPGNFTDQNNLAELFVTHAAVAMGHAHTVEGLHEALATRKVIGQALGIVMERYRLNSDRALEFLIRVSQTSNVKLRDVAAEIVASLDDGHEG